MARSSKSNGNGWTANIEFEAKLWLAADIRDTLLPKLLRGELSVRQAENTVSEVA